MCDPPYLSHGLLLVSRPLVAELAQRAQCLAANGRAGDTEHLGDAAVVVPVVVTQHQNGALARRQPRDEEPQPEVVTDAFNAGVDPCLVGWVAGEPFPPTAAPDADVQPGHRRP